MTAGKELWCDGLLRVPRLYKPSGAQTIIGCDGVSTRQGRLCALRSDWYALLDAWSSERRVAVLVSAAYALEGPLSGLLQERSTSGRCEARRRTRRPANAIPSPRRGCSGRRLRALDMIDDARGRRRAEAEPTAHAAHPPRRALATGRASGAMHGM